MGIFTGRYSFGLNVAQETNVVRDNTLSNFCGEQTELISKIWVL